DMNKLYDSGEITLFGTRSISDSNTGFKYSFLPMVKCPIRATKEISAEIKIK
ncbi:unnamed protein product, partial [marine sediment metagenome]